MQRQKEAQNATHLLFRQCDIFCQGFGFLVGTSVVISVRNLLWVEWVRHQFPTLMFNSEVRECTGGTRVVRGFLCKVYKALKFINSLAQGLSQLRSFLERDNVLS